MSWAIANIRDVRALCDPLPGSNSFVTANPGWSSLPLLDPGLADEKNDDRDFFARRTRYGILQALARELYRREGAEAVRWADGAHNDLLFLCVLAAMGREDLTAAKSWFPAYKEKGQSPTNPVFHAALQGAAMRGADELLKLENTEYSESGATHFADDFDFRTYVAGAKSMAGLDEAIRYWAALDPDAVAKALREKIGVRNGYWRGVYAKAYQARASMAGEAEAARWIWPVLGELSAREKIEVYPGVLSDDTASNLALFQTIPDDAARVDFLSCALPGSGYVNDEALDLSKELKSEALRVETMERWLENHEKYPPASLRQSLEKLVDHAGLSPASRDALRAKIPDP